MIKNRSTFSTGFGFILAASGSAIGLGNIWGFPTMVANNGGAAYVLTYLIMVLLLALPVLITEILIGYHSQSNQIDALAKISGRKNIGIGVGYSSFVVAMLILSFYAIVGGWVLGFAIYYAMHLIGVDASWFITNSAPRNILLTAVFLVITAIIVAKGVKNGIEKWSTRLMPLLLLILILLIIYVSQKSGAIEGLKHYIIPDFSKVLHRSILLDAIGQAFFSLSLGVGTMLVYGSYIRPNSNVVKLSCSVAILDVTIAILAGLLIIPAMFVAQNNGVEIMNGDQIIGGVGVVFAVLPELFNGLLHWQMIVPVAFFMLLLMAAVTSSISMLEVPSSVINERWGKPKPIATYSITLVISAMSLIIIAYFEQLFGLIITVATQYAQPLLGLAFCLIVGWIWKRGEQLATLTRGNPETEKSLFWRIWPFYIKYICPLLIVAMFTQSFI